MFALFPFFSKKKSPREQEITLFILQRFGYKIKNVALFEKALTHKSYANNFEAPSNERLEFLGDAALDLVIADLLYQKYPNEDEGYLTKIKSKIVSRRTLGMIAHEMELSRLMNYNKGRSIKLETIEGNAFEAIIGAIYLDGGIGNVQKSFVNHVFRIYVDLNQLLEEEIDFKSKLFIWSQKNRLPITFEVISEDNSGGDWVYVIRIMINEKEFGRGAGSSKKKAEQAAAKETLELMGEL